MKNYKITWEDGYETHLQLDDNDHKLWKERVDSKTSTVKSIVEGEPEPFNKPAAQPARRSGG